MNAIVPVQYDELSHRLALGLEVVDAPRDHRVARPISIAFDGVPLPLPRARAPYEAFGFTITDVLPRADRHASCQHAIVYKKGLYRPGKHTTVELRFLSDDRVYVPRILSFPLVDPSLPEPPTADPSQAVLDALRAARWRRVALFGGAAYDVGGGTTGLRGRARRSGKPLRWARVEARQILRDGTRGPVFARAHGDDRGEFLLLLGPIAGAALAALTLDVEVTVHGRTADPPTPTPADVFKKNNDPLWDLPLEKAVAPPPADAVSMGLQIPTGYTAMPKRSVTFQLGRILSSEVSPFSF